MEQPLIYINLQGKVFVETEIPNSFKTYGNILDFINKPDEFKTEVITDHSTLFLLNYSPSPKTT